LKNPVRNISITDLFLVLVCIISWSFILFRKIDLWNAAGLFFQIGIITIFCFSLFKNPKPIRIKNIPLAMLTLWMLGITSYHWYMTMAVFKQYAVITLFPFLNFLFFLLFYKLSIEYLDRENIEKILKFFSYSILTVLFYCVLQFFGLDQFLKGYSGHDEMVGTIGNFTLLGNYLAVCQPLFFKKKRFNVLCLILLWIIIGISHSASSVIIGILVVLFWLFFKNKKLFLIGLIISLILISFLIIRFPDFFNPTGRLTAWKLFYDKFKKEPILGYGLGILNVWSLKIKTSTWSQAHLSYFQIAIELGIIGLIGVLWCIKDYFGRFWKKRDGLSIRLASMFLGVCLAGLCNFPERIWLISLFGMIGYSWFYVLENEEII